MAQSGSRTLIIDCDLRKPRMHKIFHIPGSVGFTDMVVKFGTNGNKITVKRTKIPNLDLIPCGQIPPNPSEMLSSHRVKQLLNALGKKYDKILIDSPPVNVVTDPAILSQIAGGVVIIIKAGETKRDVVRRASEQLTDVGATIIGGVLNNVDVERDNYYYYSYYNNYYYQDSDDSKVLVQ
jgi:capsular exopolysaccharide synthesis family protein